MPAPPDRTQEILAAATTISDKIRALDAEGHPRAEIARLLGKRYQYVRNVLEGDRQRRQAATPAARDRPPAFGVEEGPAEYLSGTVRLQLADDGWVRIPAPVLSALGLKPGAILITEVEKDRLVVLTPKAAIAKVQAMLKDFAPGVSLSDELIADRRREDAQEREDG
jgi:antitoxin component of MazEF toxin-antitoxin module